MGRAVRLLTLVLLTLVLVSCGPSPSPSPSPPSTTAQLEVQLALAAEGWAAAEAESNPKRKPQRWAEAADAYSTAADLGGSSRHAEVDLRYAALLSWQNALATGGYEPAAGAEKQQHLSVDQKKFLSAIRAYAALLPHANGHKPMTMFLEARVYWRHGQCRTAAPLFERIVRAWPADEVAGYAALLWLECLSEGTDTKRYDSAVETMLASPSLLKERPELTERLRALEK